MFQPRGSRQARTEWASLRSSFFDCATSYFLLGFVKRSLSRLRNLYEICPRDSALESPSLPVAPVVPPSLRHPPMLLIFLCALGISFSFMATRAVPDSPPIPVGRRRSSPSRLIHAEWGGFASRFIRRCVDTQREEGGRRYLPPILLLLPPSYPADVVRGSGTACRAEPKRAS